MRLELVFISDMEDYILFTAKHDGLRFISNGWKKAKKNPLHAFKNIHALSFIERTYLLKYFILKGWSWEWIFSVELQTYQCDLNAV